MLSPKVILSFLAIQVCLLAVPVKADFCNQLKDTLSGNNSVSRRSYHVEKSDYPSVAGIMPSKCDWETGTQEDGEGRKACVAFCKDLFRNSDDCDDSRCLAWDGAYEPTGPDEGKKKDGKCSCTCGCPNLDDE